VRTSTGNDVKRFNWNDPEGGGLLPKSMTPVSCSCNSVYQILYVYAYLINFNRCTHRRMRYEQQRRAMARRKCYFGTIEPSTFCDGYCHSGFDNKCTQYFSAPDKRHMRPLLLRKMFSFKGSTLFPNTCTMLTFFQYCHQLQPLRLKEAFQL
jgi:hypothetical protein